MNTRLLGTLAFATLVVTLLWLVFLIAGLAAAGPLNTFEQVLAFVSRLDALFYLTYLNAALTVLAVTGLFAALYLYCKPSAPDWSLIGLVFVPVYATMNLIVYLSQITVVPTLIHFHARLEYQIVTDLLLRQMVQQWNGSGLAFFNNLAYALLGIPSIIFGVSFFRRAGLLWLSGLLLALNGVACIVGVVGLLLGNSVLGLGSLVGGVLFLLALILLSIAFLKQR